MSISIKKLTGFGFATAIIVVLMFSFGMTARAETNTTQSAQIAQLKQIITQLQTQLARIQGSSGVGQCIQLELSRSLSRGSTDTETNGEVTKLQQFLIRTGYYTYGKSTGYFGPETELALQQWQKAQGVVSGGSPVSTGYGVAGPATRSVLARGCAGIKSGMNAPVEVASSIQTQLEQSVILINKSVPVMIDEETRLEKSYSLNMKINYNYTITNNYSRSKNKATLDATQKNRIDQYCLNPLIYWYRINNIPMVWHYYDKKGTFMRSYEASNDNCKNSSKVKVDTGVLKPEIILTFPTRSAIFNKSTSNDDVVLRWSATDVPENTNVHYQIIAVNPTTGTTIIGSSGQVKAYSGTGEHRLAIDIPGTLSAGEYKVQLSLQACHSLGCNASYSFGPLKENLETYDTSSYGYFKIINSAISTPSNLDSNSSSVASVNLIAAGRADSTVLNAAVTDRLDFNYYPSGDIDECVVTAKYSGGEESVTHPWPNAITSGQYGRATFSVVSVYPKIILEKVVVTCKNDRGVVVGTDVIDISVDNSDTAAYKIDVAGSIESGTGMSQAEARSRCLKKTNDNPGKRVQCSWDGNEFFDDINLKG